MLPAYAGMIGQAVVGGVGQVVLPAYAGMIPLVEREGNENGRAPRVCGDDPGEAPARMPAATCSPRMRG